MVSNFFTAKLETVVFNFAFFSFFYASLTNKARKLEVAESNPLMEKFPISLSLCRLFFLSYFLLTFLSLSLSLSLSLYLSLSLSLFVDAAFQVL